MECSTNVNGGAVLDYELLVDESSGEKYAVVSKGRNVKGKLTVPAEINGCRVRGIKESAFAYCKELTEVTLSSGLETIGDRAFGDCVALTSVAIPDGVTSIGSGAFCCCFALTGVVVPDSVVFIGAHAFADCSCLENVIIPQGLRFVGTNAFIGSRCELNDEMLDLDLSGWRKVIEVKKPFSIEYSVSCYDEPFSGGNDIKVWPGVKFQITSVYVDENIVYLCQTLDEAFEERAVMLDGHFADQDLKDCSGYVKWFYLPESLIANGTVELVEPSGGIGKWVVLIKGIGERIVEAQSIDDVPASAVKTYRCELGDLYNVHYLSPLMARNMGNITNVFRVPDGMKCV